LRIDLAAVRKVFSLFLSLRCFVVIDRVWLTKHFSRAEIGEFVDAMSG